ncbi:MAG: thioredoxin family protein [Kiloniellales bacterium]
MAAVSRPGEIGWKAAEFNLEGIDNQHWTLAQARGPKGLLVIFMCNHCPYVQSVVGRMVRDVSDLAAEGIGAIAINPNDATAYPQDSFEKMKEFAKSHGLNFPYVVDPTQQAARTYEAVCTPEFFGFNKDLELQYRGRLDESRTILVENARRELYEAMRAIASSGKGPVDQKAAIGCSIKWRAA